MRDSIAEFCFCDGFVLRFGVLVWCCQLDQSALGELLEPRVAHFSDSAIGVKDIASSVNHRAVSEHRTRAKRVERHVAAQVDELLAARDIVHKLSRAEVVFHFIERGRQTVGVVPGKNSCGQPDLFEFAN